MRVRLLTGLTAVALLLAGCGDDDDPDVTPTTQAGGGATSTSTSAASDDGAAGEDGGTATTTTLADGTASTTTAAGEGGTTTSLGPATLDDASSVSTVGLDTVSFGMSLTDAEEAAGTPFLPEGPIARCTVFTPEEGPEGIRFTVLDGTVERVDIEGGPVTTRSGLGIGSTVQQVLDRFGAQAQLTARPDGSGDDIVFVPTDEADAQFRVIFETDGAVVTRFRAGRLPVVLPSAPCAAVQLPAAPSSSVPA